MISKIWLSELEQQHVAFRKGASKKQAEQFLETLLEVVFPGYGTQDCYTVAEMELVFKQLEKDLSFLLSDSNPKEEENAYRVETFFKELQGVHSVLKTDVKALLDGDPAAVSDVEIIQSYPGFFAISAYRIAHLLHQLGVKQIPRMLTEYAHSKTGIDIHPGAEIGASFFIDHGTGVVIGETTKIGVNVKVYQGVTLGALSVSKKLAATKRHPTIEDHVVIYAGATILGGETVIGAHSVIGGNAWITNSVPAHSKVFHSPTTIIKSRKHGTVN